MASAPPAPLRYLWQQPGWPALRVDAAALAPALDAARLEQGRLLGLLDAIGLVPAQEVAGDLWVREALSTARIEGQQLELAAVRSSVARRLGLPEAVANAPDRSADGLVWQFELRAGARSQDGTPVTAAAVTPTAIIGSLAASTM